MISEESWLYVDPKVLFPLTSIQGPQRERVRDIRLSLLGCYAYFQRGITWVEVVLKPESVDVARGILYAD